ncbi:hypothetical protein AO269_19385 [Pseudomonas putida]|nr:hypothetical protein AO269_19385 [Pseudomonas putida]
MSVQARNNVVVKGQGPLTLVFAHGFGCDQNMWRMVEPTFAKRYRTVLFDMVGCGKSDVGAYDIDKYSTLAGYAEDIVEIIQEFKQGPVVFIGHSVGAMAGVMAANLSPGLISAHAMVGPSPSYITDEDYPGGFTRDDIDALLSTLESNYLGWSSAMAPRIMGNSNFIAPRAVGEYLTQVIDDCRMVLVENEGHCPHLSQPAACIEAIQTFLDQTCGHLPA